MERLESVLQKADFVSKIFYYISAAVLAILFLLIFFDIIGRSLFSTPITGVNVLSDYLMVVVGFLPLGYGMLRGTHVKMEYFGDLLFKRQRKYIDLLVTLLAMAFFIIMTYEISKEAYSDWATQVLQSDATVPWPVWYQSLIAAIGSAMLVIALAMQFIRKVLLIVSRLPNVATRRVDEGGV